MRCARKGFTAARRCPSPMQFKIEPFKHPLKLDPNYAGAHAFFLSMTASGWGGLGCSCCLLLLLAEGFCIAAFVPPALEVWVVHAGLMSASWLSLAENTWKILESAIGEINAHNASGLSYEELYRLVGSAAASYSV